MYQQQKIVPLRLAIRYAPPSLFLIYRYNLKDKKMRRYRIELNSLAFLPDATQITDQLYIEHPAFLNDHNVEYEQVLKLVNLLHNHMKRQKKSVIKNLDEVNSYIESDNDLNKSVVMENEDDVYDQDWKTPINNRTETIYPKDNTSVTRFSQKILGNDSNLSLTGMQQFMQSQNPRQKFNLPIQNTVTPIQRSRLANDMNDMAFVNDNVNEFPQEHVPPRQSRYIEDAIQNQQSYYLKNNKYITLPEPLLNRDNQKSQYYY